MTKEEAINFIIEEAKRGNNQAHRDFCGKYATCKECPLEGDESCRNVLFNSLIERFIKAEEHQETNLEHYYDSKLAFDKGVTDDIYTLCFKARTDEAYKKSGIYDFKRWLLSPYEKPKYKLSKFEYDLLNSYNPETRSPNMFNYFSLDTMRKKGYFKDIHETATFEEVLDNCEVEVIEG